MKIILKVKRSFDSAHFLKDYIGPCAELHGHTWKVVIGFNILKIDCSNMSVDFKLIKKLVDNILPDHQCLNTFYNENNPTAEWLAGRLLKDIEKEIYSAAFEKLISIAEIEIFETENNSVYLAYKEAE
jgi:6-pyruvoyltetrahydropterin/6-carboxytetrahydropterin synthase